MEIVIVNTLPTGEIDLNHLKECLLEGKRQSRSAILNVNCGTTVRGAVDDLDGVLVALEKTGYSQEEFYIHVDGALFGMMLPFIQVPPPYKSSPLSFLTPLSRSTASSCDLLREAYRFHLCVRTQIPWCPSSLWRDLDS